MKAALIGLPNSGKSTVFSAVTGEAADPYAPPKPRHAMIRVPDSRLAYLAGLYNPKKVVEATLDFVDIPGCALDDAKGRDEWRRLLPEVRQADMLVVVLREFENPAVPAYRDRVDAHADYDIVWEELIFADLDTVTTRVERLEEALKKPTKTHDIEKRQLALLLRCQEALELEKPLAGVLTTGEERRHVSGFAFVTEKPIVVIRNISDEAPETDGGWSAAHAKETISLRAGIESEIAALSPEDRPAFLAEMGLAASALDRLIRSCYRACGLISFLTVGSDEVRAWTVQKGSVAVDAAAKIHTDIGRGFIRAETVAYDDLVAHKDMRGAKAAGLVRKEGKTYVVQDGDIINFLSNP